MLDNIKKRVVLLISNMNKRYLALTLVVVGFVIYFFPQFQQFTSDKSQLTGAIFAVGGVILWYLPKSSDKGSKK